MIGALRINGKQCGYVSAHRTIINCVNEDLVLIYGNLHGTWHSRHSLLRGHGIVQYVHDGGPGQNVLTCSYLRQY